MRSVGCNPHEARMRRADDTRRVLKACIFPAILQLRVMTPALRPRQEVTR